MTGFKTWISVVGSDRSTNCTTTTAQVAQRSLLVNKSCVYLSWPPSLPSLLLLRRRHQFQETNISPLKESCSLTFLSLFFPFWSFRVFKSGPAPGLFLFIFVLLNKNFCIKIVDFCGIGTRIVSGIRSRTVRAEDKYADHLTTTTALEGSYIGFFTSMVQLGLHWDLCLPTDFYKLNR